ncbi:MAG TPA: winged helix-turn-helix domain-containing protein [Vicinamibacterales bacterium]|nr:winged helix-turn-helix domain-containing protein [Vicinamibacterales bacterium]
MLAALLARPGQIATRDELRERLWGTDTFVDFEHGLNTAIKKVRKALGDSADAPRFVETLARRGYRFIAPVTVVTADLNAAGLVRTPPAPPPPVARANRAVGRLLATVVILSAAAGVWFAYRQGLTAPAQERQRPAQLAVLPFRVLPGTAAGDMSYVGVAIADAIITRLAGTGRLALRATPAVLPYRDAQIAPASIASALGVQYLLIGTIQPSDSSYRFRVQLVDANGIVVWGRAYDEPRGALLVIEDHIAGQIAAALGVHLSPPERARLHRRYTENPEAYDLYLRGRALLVSYTDPRMREALRYFEQAVALDERYALAHAGMATAAAWFSVRYAYESEALAWGRRADDEAHLALAQDPLLADAQLAIASAAGTLYGGFNWKAVLDGTRTALALDPSLDLAHVVRMRALYHLGRFDDAADEARLARTLNPGSNVEIARIEAAILIARGDYAAALAAANRLVRETDVPAARHYLGLARYYSGDAAGARDVLASVMRGGKPDVRAQASLASVEAAAGLTAPARERIAAIVRGAYMDHHVAYSLGAAYAQLGDRRNALTWLQRAVDSGLPCGPCLARDPLLEPLRGDPAFKRMLSDLENKPPPAI